MCSRTKLCVARSIIEKLGFVQHSSVTKKGSDQRDTLAGLGDPQAG